MADATKHVPINGGTLISDIKSLFSLIRTKRTVAFAYGFVFAFVAFTVFLAFSPSSNSSSPWFTNIFTTTTSSNSSTIFSDDSNRSHSSSIFSYFFPNSTEDSHNFTSKPSQTNLTRSQNTTFEPEIVKNQTKNKDPHDKIGGSNLNPNQTTIGSSKTPISVNQNSNSVPKPSSEVKNSTGIGEKGGTSGSNLTSSLVKKQKNETNLGVSVKQKQGSENLVDSLMNCDVFDGEWVKDDSYPLYKPGSCLLIDPQFNCFLNGRPDSDYQKLKWKPKGCTLPRLNGSHMLELLRGKRLVFVGDSLNRNMWESLVCILRNTLKDQSKVYEATGKHQFRGEASYSFIFQDYNCTIEFFASPFLVQEWEIPEKNGKKKETLRLDLIGKSSDKYKNADILIFNTGHWWTHEKTAKGQDYYQEGSHVYGELNVLEAFRKALTTWARWVDANVNTMKTVVFFRGYSASHFRGGEWNSGGQCDNETEPIKNVTYLDPYPPKMTVLENILKGMKHRISFLNITRLTDYRKDGHPSIYGRKQPHIVRDCSHWCLPGVPDAWNELLYAEMLMKQNQKKRS